MLTCIAADPSKPVAKAKPPRTLKIHDCVGFRLIEETEGDGQLIPGGGRFKYECINSDDVLVEFPWELNSTDYLRRVLACAAQVLQPMYATAVSTGGLDKVRQDGEEKDAEELDVYYALSHVEENAEYYSDVLGINQELTTEIARGLKAASSMVARAGFAAVPEEYVEDALVYCVLLVSSSGGDRINENFLQLRQQWEAHTDSKQARADGRPGFSSPGEESGRRPSQRARQGNHISFTQDSDCNSEDSECDSCTSPEPGQETPARAKETAEKPILSLRQIQVVMQASSGSADVQTMACSAIASLLPDASLFLFGDDTLQLRRLLELASQLGLMSHVRQAMRAFPDCDRLQTRACQAITVLTHGGDMHAELDEPKGIWEDIQAAMASRVSSAELQTWACKAAAKLGSIGAECVTAEALGVLTSVQDAMREHRVDWGVQLSALKAVQKFGVRCNLDADQFISSLHAIQATIRASRRVNTSVLVQAASALTYMFDAHAALKLEPGLLRSLLADVQPDWMLTASQWSWVFFAVVDLTRRLSEQRVEIDPGVLSSVQTVMRHCRENQDMQKLACRVVEFVTADNGANQAEAVRIGLLEDIQTTMRKCDDDPDTQHEACTALHSIVGTSKSRQAAARRLGLLGDVQAAMEMHRGKCGDRWMETFQRMYDLLIAPGAKSRKRRRVSSK